MSLDCILSREPLSNWDKFWSSPTRFIAQRIYSLSYTPPSPTDVLSNSTRIAVVCVSDTHNSHANIPPLPDGDILVHAGDLTQSGTEEEVHQALRWLEKQPHLHKVFIAGNHDRALEDASFRAVIASAYPSLTYLHDSCVTLNIEGKRVTVYGSPRTPRHGSWPFQYPRIQPHQVSSSTVWEGIPSHVDILVTHGPPVHHLDCDGSGCEALLTRLWEVRPSLHVHGHIHARRGVQRVFWTERQKLYEDVMRGLWTWAKFIRLLWLSWWKEPMRGRGTVLVNASTVGGFRDDQIRPALAVYVDV